MRSFGTRAKQKKEMRLKLKEDIECKFLSNKAGALCLRRRSRRLRRAEGGYTNTGTLSNPVSAPVTSNKVTIIFEKDISSSKGYKLLTAYPDIN